MCCSTIMPHVDSPASQALHSVNIMLVTQTKNSAASSVVLWDTEFPYRRHCRHPPPFKFSAYWDLLLILQNLFNISKAFPNFFFLSDGVLKTSLNSCQHVLPTLDFYLPAVTMKATFCHNDISSDSPMYWRTIPLSYSGSKSESRRNQHMQEASSGILPGLLFFSEDVGDMFLLNIRLSTNYTVL